jgi:hypothetical protein
LHCAQRTELSSSRTISSKSPLNQQEQRLRAVGWMENSFRLPLLAQSRHCHRAE